MTISGFLCKGFYLSEWISDLLFSLLRLEELLPALTAGQMSIELLFFSQ